MLFRNEYVNVKCWGIGTGLWHSTGYVRPGSFFFLSGLGLGLVFALFL